MKKTIAFILIGVMIITIFGCSQANDNNTKEVYNPDFRNIKWGMSKEEVKEKENSSLNEENSDGLIYEDLKFAELNAGIGYFFTGNRLNQIVVLFEEGNLYNYEKVQKYLIDQYGDTDLENSRGGTSSFWKVEDEQLSVRLTLDDNGLNIMYLKD